MSDDKGPREMHPFALVLLVSCLMVLCAVIMIAGLSLGE